MNSLRVTGLVPGDELSALDAVQAALEALGCTRLNITVGDVSMGTEPREISTQPGC